MAILPVPLHPAIQRWVSGSNISFAQGGHHRQAPEPKVSPIVETMSRAQRLVWHTCVQLGGDIPAMAAFLANPMPKAAGKALWLGAVSLCWTRKDGMLVYTLGTQVTCMRAGIFRPQVCVHLLDRGRSSWLPQLGGTISSRGGAKSTSVHSPGLVIEVFFYFKLLSLNLSREINMGE